jgi:gluconate 5-dehydrogenase
MGVSVTDLFRLDGRSAIVTGGGRGIGQWIAQGLAQAGASVMICSRNLDACSAAADQIVDQGGSAMACRCDVVDPEEVLAMVESTVDALGSIDIVVNNSGTTWGSKPEDMPLDRFRTVIDVNVTGAFLVSQAAGRVMIDQGRGGVIINIASVAGLLGGRPEVVQSAGYSASKGAVISLTRSLATAWAAHGIRVNAIAPGWFPTKMSRAVLSRHEARILADTPLARFGEPEDLSGVAVFLASPASAFMTGQVLVVDGGASVW